MCMQVKIMCIGALHYLMYQNTLGSNELAPFNTLKLPSLSKNILSTLPK